MYLKDVLGVTIECRTETKKKEEAAYAYAQLEKDENRVQPLEEQSARETEKFLVEKMSLYLAKMVMHAEELAIKPSSLLAVGAIYVALKICEQLKQKTLINQDIINRFKEVSQVQEETVILDISQRVLYLAQNFDKEFPGLENLKKTHFGVITKLL